MTLLLLTGLLWIETRAAVAESGGVTKWYRYVEVMRAAEDQLRLAIRQDMGAESTTTVKRVREIVTAQRATLAGLAATSQFLDAKATGLAVRRLTEFADRIETELPGDPAKPLSLVDITQAIRRAQSATFAVIESAGGDDRVGVVFGIGITAIYWDREDTERFSVRSEQNGGNTQLVLTRDSRSVTFPAVMTGLAARIRDRWQPPRKDGVGATLAWAGTRGLDWMVPTTLFGSAQLGLTSVSGANGGVALGIGWQLVGDVHLLLGFNSVRLGSLRSDLRDQLNAAGGRRLVLTNNETDESIRGAEVSSGIILVLAAPVGLKSVFGGS